MQGMLVSIINKLLPQYPEVQTARQVALWLLEAVTEQKTAQLLTKQIILTEQQQYQLETMIHEHLYEHKPLQYILGHVPFLDLELIVEPPVLIPRPETEEWCHWLIQQLQSMQEQPLTIADVGTGTGCIGLALAQALPHATVYALDTAPEALRLAHKNAVHNDINNIHIKRSDLLAQVADISFDLIVSNPPYISEQEYMRLSPAVQRWEDKNALMASDEGLALIKIIVRQAASMLKKNVAAQQNNIPRLLIEIDRTQADTVAQLYHQAGFERTTVLKDLFGNDRVVVAY